MDKILKMLLAMVPADRRRELVNAMEAEEKKNLLTDASKKCDACGREPAGDGAVLSKVDGVVCKSCQLDYEKEMRHPYDNSAPQPMKEWVAEKNADLAKAAEAKTETLRNSLAAKQLELDNSRRELRATHFNNLKQVAQLRDEGVLVALTDVHSPDDKENLGRARYGSRR